MRGYKGLVDDEIIDLQSDSVSNIIQQGGTMLKTARSQEFMTPEGRRRAYENMKRSGIDALVVIGGDGSLKGACIFAQEFDVPIVGLPGCVMYSKRTIFDLVLPRLIADDEVKADELAGLGEGGLCLNCKVCTFPNCGFGKGR